MLQGRSRKGMKRQSRTSTWTALAAPATVMAAKRLCVAACLALWMPAALAQQAGSDKTLSAAASRYPAGTIRTIEQADQALADVNRERSEIESRYKAEEYACHPRFFATSCIEQAQERRRKATMELRAVEIEANVLKRRVRVEERDKALEARSTQAESERVERARPQQGASDTAAGPVRNEPPARTSAPAPRKAPKTADTDRVERHDAKMARIQAEEAAKANERAENIAEYEQKVQASKARQEEVARRKAEKERKRLVKQSPVPASQ